jgi:hypothetical protein
MAELVCEYTHSAVLGLYCIFAHPVAAVSDLDSTILIEIRAGLTYITRSGIPAVAPDGCRRCAALFTLTGVN